MNLLAEELVDLVTDMLATDTLAGGIICENAKEMLEDWGGKYCLVLSQKGVGSNDQV